jgi:REP element-mobilizing transposase RayT
MTYDPQRHHRRSVRLQGYDYTQPGAYFVTVCTQDRASLFGEILEEQIRLNEAGGMVQRMWAGLPDHFPFLKLGEYVIMPNHLHAILVLTDLGDHEDRPYGMMMDRRGESCIRPFDLARDHPRGTLTGTVGRVVQAFKSITTHEYVQGVQRRGWPPFAKRLWQRNYYEHIIRNELELNDVRRYIQENPARWATDENNPDRLEEQPWADTEVCPY